MTRLCRNVPVGRTLRLWTALTTLLIWLQMTLYHFRGSFQSIYQWLPVLGLPIAFIIQMVGVFQPDATRARNLSRFPALFTAFEGLTGTVLHLRGIGRKMGGYRNLKYNVITGPPFPAPPQLGLMGLIGVAAATLPEEKLEPVTDAANALGYLLFAAYAAYNHWIGYFFNKLMFIPVTVAPLMSIVHLGSLFKMRWAQRLKVPLSILVALGSLLGFGAHIYHDVKRRRGFFDPQGKVRWQTVFFGAPLMLPLLLMGYAVTALLTAGSGRCRA